MIYYEEDNLHKDGKDQKVSVWQVLSRAQQQVSHCNVC